MAISKYVDSTEQLVVELLVSNLDRSIDFYTALGFTLLRREGSFAALAWEEHRLFLDEVVHAISTARPMMNVRIMVADVDACWSRAGELGSRIVAPIADRHYGLRDFTIADPDGFGVRFASWLPRESSGELRGAV